MSLKGSDAGGRTKAFSRNQALEDLLGEVNSLLSVSEERLLETQGPAKYPAIFIMGPMRSGTTLFMQWLASTGIVAYPTNLLSRFYRAPIVGAKIQLLLTDARYSFREELGDFSAPTAYSSENGKTKGALSPNEFWYFWRRFLAEPQRDVWSDDELRDSFDAVAMTAELAGMMDVFQKPFAAKGILFNYNIPYLDSLFDKALFVHIKRDPVANVASVLEARKRQFGGVDTWYSFKIPEFEKLVDSEPVEQVAGQIHYINKALAEGLHTVSESRKLVVDYGDFCQCPELYYRQLLAKLGMESIAPLYSGPEKFVKTPDVAPDISMGIEHALARYSS